MKYIFVLCSSIVLKIKDRRDFDVTVTKNVIEIPESRNHSTLVHTCLIRIHILIRHVDPFKPFFVENYIKIRLIGELRRNNNTSGVVIIVH